MTTEASTRRAESVRRMDLAEAVCRTAMRYPHLSVLALARLFGVLQSEVWAVLLSARLDRPRRNAGDEFCERNVAEDVDAGLSVQAMARKYGVSEHQVRRMAGPRLAIRREMPEREERALEDDVTQPPAAPDQAAPETDHVPRRKRCRPEDLPAKEQVKALLDEGLSGRDAARRLGIAYSTWQRLVRRYGVRGPRREVPQETEEAQPQPVTATLEVLESDHPLISFTRRGAVGLLAKDRLMALVGALDPDGRYDVQLTIREVSA